jgi:hypothetical protein
MKYKLYYPFLFCCLFFTVSSYATDYFFTGNGDWNVAANWQDGLVPAGIASDVIYINGTAQTSSNNGAHGSHTCSGSGCDHFYTNNGTIIVSIGGTLTLNNSTQFSNNGSIIINGTLINNTIIEGFSNGTVTVNGKITNNFFFGNQGLVTLNSGGLIDNQLNATFSNTGTQNFTFPIIGRLVINSGGTFNNIGTAMLKAGNLTNNGTLDNQSILTGNATVTGNLTNSGTLAPGNSPGVYTIGGDYTATATAVHNFEVGGTASSNYDRLNAGGNVYLNGTLNVSLISGFVPSDSNPDLPIITGTINGTFATVNKPNEYLLIYNNNSVVLRVSSTLPVSFSYVDVKKEGTAARLTWNVQTESNVLKYEVERSSNGNNYRKVGEVAAISLTQYTYTDVAPHDKNYYRIKSVDRDGKFSYSIVVTYSQGKSSVSLRAFPSPAKSELNIQHPSATAASRIVITAMDGRTLQTIFPAGGVQKTTVDVSGLNKGMYLARYINGNELVGSVTFLKQ